MWIHYNIFIRICVIKYPFLKRLTTYITLLSSFQNQFKNLKNMVKHKFFRQYIND